MKPFTRFLILFFFFIAVIGVATTIFSTKRDKAELIDIFRNWWSSEVRALSSEVESYFILHLKLARTIATTLMESDSEFQPKLALLRQLEQRLGKSEDIAGLYLAHPDGTVYRTDGTFFNGADRLHLKEVMKGTEGVIHIKESRSDGKDIFLFLTPILDARASVTSALGMTVLTDTVIQQLSGLKIPFGGFVALKNNDGSLFFSRGEVSIPDSSIFKSASLPKSAIINGEEFLLFESRIRPAGWKLLLGFPEKKAMEQIPRFREYNALLIGFLAALAVATCAGLILRSQNELLAREKRNSHAREVFLAKVSHEIRTPLNAVTGTLELLSEKDIPPTLQEPLALIRSSSDTLLGLVNDLLESASLTSGEFSVCPVPFKPYEAFDTTVKIFTPRAVQQGLTFTMLNSCAPTLLLNGDPIRLNQIVTNFLANSFKFTDSPGEVCLSVSATSLQNSTALLTLTVADSGIGIPEEKQQQIFEEFSQIGSSVMRVNSGVGLGLAIVKKIAQKMGGEVSVQSIVGKGAKFTASFPLPIVDASQESIKDGRVSLTTSHDNLSVLVVEDNAVNRKIAKAMLEKLHHRAELASSGEEALLLLQKSSYDLILMDVQMPGVDGLTVTREIRRREKISGAIATRIVALTAHALPEDRRSCLEAGMNDYLTKPVKLEDLRRVCVRS